MQVLFQAPERQQNNYQFEDVVAGTQLPYHKVVVVFDVVSMDAGAFCDVTIAPERSGQTLVSVTNRFASVGQHRVGAKYGQDTDIDYRVRIAMTGRMRVQIRVVAFDQGEDVPEVIT